MNSKAGKRDAGIPMYIGTGSGTQGRRSERSGISVQLSAFRLHHSAFAVTLAKVERHDVLLIPEIEGLAHQRRRRPSA